MDIRIFIKNCWRKISGAAHRRMGLIVLILLGIVLAVCAVKKRCCLTSYSSSVGESSAFDAQSTPTIAMFKELEKKVDDLAQQQSEEQAARIDEQIKSEVKSQIARQNEVKKKKMQVLRQLAQEVDGDK